MQLILWLNFSMRFALDELLMFAGSGHDQFGGFAAFKGLVGKWLDKNYRKALIKGAFVCPGGFVVRLLYFQVICGLLTAGLVVGISPDPTAHAAGDKTAKTEKLKKLTKAETLLFETPHLVNVSPGQTLHYSFQRISRLGDGYKDHVSLKVDAGETRDVRNVSFEFFTGERRRPYPPLSYVTANPLLTIYFNRDAWGLAGRIKAKGVANYLRNRILDALGDEFEISSATCRYQDRDVEGKTLQFQPFAKDKNRHHLVHYSAMRYEITISDELPGGLCQIKSIVPYPSERTPDHFLEKLKKSGMMSLASEVDVVRGLDKRDEPLIVEMLSFEQVGSSKVGSD